MSDNSIGCKCIACKQAIESDASICSLCGSSQTTWLRWFNIISNPVSMAISLAAFLISVYTFNSSLAEPVRNPEIEIQVIDFGETDFTFFAYNVGDAPSIVKSIDLNISLVQQDGSHLAKASFDLEEPVVLNPADSVQLIVPYSSYIPRWSRWEVTDPPPPDFSQSFLYAASGLGNNLHCELGVIYTRSGYYDFVGKSVAQTNGNCVGTMEWFATSLGPLMSNQ